MMNMILAVLPNRATRETVKAAMSNGHHLVIENGLDDTLRRLVTLDVDLILVDDAPSIGLRTVEGLAKAVPNVPVVALTSRKDIEYLAAFTMAGARRCLNKPITPSSLDKAIDEVRKNPPRVDSETPASQGHRNGREDTATHAHRAALRWMSRRPSAGEDIRRSAHGIVEAAVDVFNLNRAALLLQSGTHVRVAASHGLSEQIASSLRLSYTSGLMRRLEEVPAIFENGAPCDAPEARKEMQLLGARIAAPLFNDGRVCGALILGDKALGEPFNAEEKELVTVLARDASLYLEKGKAHRDSAQKHHRLDALIANLAAGVVTVRPNRTVSMMNAAAEEILGLHAEEVLGRSVQKLGSAFADVVLRALNQDDPVLEGEIQDPVSKTSLGLSVTPLGPEGVAVYFTPVADAPHRDEDILYSPIWTYLASRAAQEIKNPMVAINTFAQLLPQRYDSDEFRHDFADVVQKEVARINRVVETLFDFAKDRRLSMQQSDLNETVRQILQDFEGDLLRRSIKLETRFDPEDLEIQVDPTLFSKAVGNVVQNSIEAMPKGGTLKVTTTRAKDALGLLIEDTGPGIGEEDASHIFEPFFSTKERGMGLGLTMANRIIEQHKGKLELLSGTEGGAFVFRLPMAV